MNFTIFGEEFCVYKYCLLYIKQPFCVECLHQIDRLGLSRLKRSFLLLPNLAWSRLRVQLLLSSSEILEAHQLIWKI